LARRSLQGAVRVEGGGVSASFALLDGHFELDRVEHTDFMRSFDLRDARYTLGAAYPSRGGRTTPWWSRPRW
jgi:hypothetical protein